MKRVAILNDTAGRTKHFGCQRVMTAFEDLCHKHDLEIVYRESKKISYETLDASRPDLILINGEGSIHDGNYEWLLDVALEYPTALLNCSLQNLTQEGREHLADVDLVQVRESYSYEYVRNYCNVRLAPDVFFYGGNLALVPSALSSDDTFYTDSSKGDAFHRYTYLPKQPFYLQEMARYGSVSAGRFHALCAAAMLRKPFVGFAGNTWKNQALMEDMGAGDLYTPRQRDWIDSARPAFCPLAVDEYVRDATARIDEVWEEVAKL